MEQDGQSIDIVNQRKADVTIYHTNQALRQEVLLDLKRRTFYNKGHL